jgi:peptidoglycan hydrolase CwlO-like protein
MALSKLKSLFKDNLNNKDNSTQIENNLNQSEEPLYENYEEWGFKKGGHLNGSHSGLLTCLARIREDHKRMVRKDELKQNRLKQPLITLRNTQLEEIEQKNEQINGLKDKLPILENKIESLQKDIISIRKNPQEVIPDKMSKVSFTIGSLILTALSIYLFIFYSSASFSAFFKEFSFNEIGVANSIFDPQAISRAYQDGFTELILIISMPFVFIGLGFLIHKFQEKKGFSKFFKIGLLIIITFLFDAILAYEITEKIYNIKAENSFQDIPEYNFQLAFESVNFWLIIFAGFIVYLIWGFVFDFTIEAYDKINVVKQAIKAKQSEITIYKQQLEKNEEIISKLREEINSLKLKCKNLKGKIDGVIIDTAEFDKILHEFLGGWTHWMSANKKEQSFIDQATEKAHEFIVVNIKILETNNLDIV